jgi:hypothetical protein
MLKKVLLLAMIIYFWLHLENNTAIQDLKNFELQGYHLPRKESLNKVFKLSLIKVQQLLILYTKLTSKRIFTTHPNLTATTDSLVVNYLKFPDFLTKVYRNENITVVNSDINTDKIYKIDKIIEKDTRLMV